MGGPVLFVEQLFNGFSVASLYLLAALGLALSFGLMRVINMAHGEMLMLGGYLAYLTLQGVPGPLGFLVAMPVAFLGTAALGAVIEIAVISVYFIGAGIGHAATQLIKPNQTIILDSGTTTAQIAKKIKGNELGWCLGAR